MDSLFSIAYSCGGTFDIVVISSAMGGNCQAAFPCGVGISPPGGGNFRSLLDGAKRPLAMDYFAGRSTGKLFQGGGFNAGRAWSGFSNSAQER